MMDIEKKIDAIRGGHLHVIASLTIGENMEICKRLRNAEAENEQLRQRITYTNCNHVEHNLNMAPRITEQDARGIKEILINAAQVVLMRHGDVNTEDGSFATVDIDALLRLDYVLAEHFQLDSDDVTFENIDDLISKINKLNADRDPDYEAMEREHFGDSELKTGIYAEQVPAVSVPEPRKCCGNPVMDNGYVCCGDYLYGDDAMIAAPSHSQQSATWLKDHQIAEVINAVRDVAETYSGTQQLRERIAGVLRPVLCSYGNRCPSHESEQPAPDSGPRSCMINGYELTLTSAVCPEQYDVRKDGVQAGYLRLRSGEFTVEVPDFGGHMIIEADDFMGDGCFEDDDERTEWLTRAIEAIDRYSAPDSEGDSV